MQFACASEHAGCEPVSHILSGRHDCWIYSRRVCVCVPIEHVFAFPPAGQVKKESTVVPVLR